MARNLVFQEIFDGGYDNVGDNLDAALSEQDALIEQIKTALQGKVAGGVEPAYRNLYHRVEYIESA